MAGRRKAKDFQDHALDGGGNAKIEREWKPEALVLEKPAPRGRRLALTSEEIDTFCRALNAPCTFEVAAAVVGRSPRTMHDWIAKGQDPECDDEIMVELSAKYAQTMAGGNRKAVMGLLVDHAVDDAKTAVALAQMLIPSTNTTKNVKIEATVEAQKQTPVPYHLATDAEALIIEQAERIIARLKSLV